MRRVRVAVFLVLLILSLPQQLVVLASQDSFKLISYKYHSSSGEPTIYPGSRNVELTVELMYQGEVGPASSVSGCLTMPKGFLVARGHTSCSPAYTLNGSVATVVRPGDVVVFKFYFDVSEDVEPGSYTFYLEVYYTVNTSRYVDTETLRVKVSPYPEIGLRVVDWYWSPDAYPGSQGVALNIVVENRGNSSIVEAHGYAQLPEAFEPRKVRVDLGALQEDEMATVTLAGLSVYPNASLANYTVVLALNVTARTSDGVEYHAENVTLEFNVTLSEPPSVWLDEIDYGVTAPHSVGGLRETRFYVTFQVKSFVTIRALTAVFRVVEGGSFVNGSRTGVTTLTGGYGYGDYLTVMSPPIVYNATATRLVVELNLTIFGSKGESEFWSLQRRVYTVPISKPALDVGIVEAYWGSQRVYPGTAGATLNVVLENLDTLDLVDAVAVLELPPVFEPRRLVVSGANIPHASRTTVAFSGIDVDTGARPGIYIANLTIDGIARGGNREGFYRVQLVFHVPVVVAERYGGVFNLTMADWVGGRAYTTTVAESVRLLVTVAKPVRVESLVAHVHLPPQLVFTDGSRSMNISVGGGYGYGDTISFTVPGVCSATSSPSTVPVVVELHALLSSAGAETWYHQVLVAPLRLEKPRLNLTLVSVSWAGGKAHPGASGATLIVQLVSEHLDEVDSLIAKLYLIEGARFSSGMPSSTVGMERPIGYGELVSLQFTRVEIEPGAASVSGYLDLVAYVRLGDGYYRATSRIKVEAPLAGAEEPLLLANTTTLYEGGYAPLLPTARGVLLQLQLVNTKSYTITSITPRLELPEGFRARRVYGDCLRGVAPGSTCTLNIELDVDAKPGRYMARLVLNIVERVGDSVAPVSQEMLVPLLVAPPEAYTPRVRVLNAYWGRAEPIVVYEHQRHVPVTVTLVNPGRYTVENVRLHLAPLNESIAAELDTVMCSPRLAPGATCTATLWLDLANATSGVYLFRVRVDYTFTEYGAHIPWEETYTVKLAVARYAGGAGLALVDSGWANNWPVYPDTENATYTVTLANRWPFTVEGVELRLELPDGFTSEGSRVATAYVEGPVASLQTLSVSFRVTVGNVTPGEYTARLVARYVVMAGGQQLLWTDTFNVTLHVSSLSEAVTLLTPSWLGGAPEPPVYGAILVVGVRDDNVPRMRGPLLEVELPPGITCSLNNASRVVLAPGTTPPPVQAPTYPAGYQELLRYLGQLAPQQPVGEYARGSILQFYLPLNILVDKPGVYVAKAYLNFIDQWDNVRRIPLAIPLRVHGASRIVEVSADPVIVFVNGTSTLRLRVRNVGTAPIHNTYIMVVPQSPVALPAEGPVYVGTIGPNQTIVVPVTLVYNPVKLVQLGGEALEYQSLPILITVAYRDALGYQHVFNTTVATIIQPFVHLALSQDTRAKLEDGRLTVSGAIINYGISTARSIRVLVEAGTARGSAFVGDLEPASQAAFRVDVEGVPAETKTVKLVISYLDNYGREHTRTFTLGVEHVKPKKATTTTPQPRLVELAASHWAVVVMVAVFLAVTAAAIILYLRRHGRVVEQVQV